MDNRFSPDHFNDDLPPEDDEFWERYDEALEEYADDDWFLDDEEDYLDSDDYEELDFNK